MSNDSCIVIRPCRDGEYRVAHVFASWFLKATPDEKEAFFIDYCDEYHIFKTQNAALMKAQEIEMDVIEAGLFVEYGVIFDKKD